MSLHNNKAILLVTFGTNVSQAAKAFENLEKRVRDNFSDIEIRWSYTAKSIRTRLASEGRIVDSPITALAKLQDEGFTKVAVQSVHILPGQEFYDLVNVVDNMLHFRGSSGKHFQSKIGKFGFESLSLGTPLLYDYEDFQEVIDALRNYIPPDRQSHALVLVGHGSAHHAFSAYGCFNDMLRQAFSNVFLGTIEGYPSLNEVKKDLEKTDTKKITIMPFMNIAGEHAIKDLAGEEDSWKSELKKSYEVVTDLTGLLENEKIVDLYIKHIKQALHKLS